MVIFYDYPTLLLGLLGIWLSMILVISLKHPKTIIPLAASFHCTSTDWDLRAVFDLLFFLRPLCALAQLLKTGIRPLSDLFLRHRDPVSKSFKHRPFWTARKNICKMMQTWLPNMLQKLQSWEKSQLTSGSHRTWGRCFPVWTPQEGSGRHPHPPRSEMGWSNEPSHGWIFHGELWMS